MLCSCKELTVVDRMLSWVRNYHCWFSGKRALCDSGLSLGRVSEDVRVHENN